MAQQIPFSFFGQGETFATIENFTLDPTNVDGTNLDTSAEVTDEGGGTVTDKGICWSTSPSFTSSNCLSSGGGGLGTFTVIIGITTPLLNDTIYYFRAYAQNSQGTYYSESLQFNTSYVPMQFVIETTVPNETIAIAGNDSLSLNLSVDAWIDWADGSDPENFILSVIFSILNAEILASSSLPKAFLSS